MQSFQRESLVHVKHDANSAAHGLAQDPVTHTVD